MLKGFEIFETRENGFMETIEKFPPLYKIFYSTFNIGQGKLKVPGVYLEQINQVAGIFEQKIDCNMDFVIYDFLSFEEANIFIHNTYEKDDDIRNLFYPIAECDSNKAVIVGTHADNLDQIFIENTNLFSDGSRYKFLASNIFEFILKISYTEMERIGYGINSYSQLYKEWGDFNWKVKKSL